MCFDYFYNFFSKTLLILKRIEQDMINYVFWPLCKMQVILVYVIHLFSVRLIRWQISGNKQIKRILTK
jgi:hypothetical protein